MAADQTIQNFLTYLRSKQPRDWPLVDIEVFLEEIPVFYRYCDDKETCAILKSAYYKLVDWVNEKRGFRQFTRNFLDRIKKEI